jgi:hypothetical protein
MTKGLLRMTRLKMYSIKHVIYSIEIMCKISGTGKTIDTIPALRRECRE